MKISAIQFNVSEDKSANLKKIERMVAECVDRDHPDLVVLPEYCSISSPQAALMHAQAEPLDGPFAEAMSRLAQKHTCILLAGSMIENRQGRFYNTSMMFDRAGIRVGTYSKMHRFNATLADGSAFSESDLVERGDEVVVVDIEGHKIGLAICYDLRFSRLFDQLSRREASIVLLPSAFNFHSGADQWEVLVRARAIEFQYYVVAVDQIGRFGNGSHMFFGHSMISDPWGRVIAQASDQEGSITAKLDMDFLNKVRSRLPVRQHQVLP
jgi:predicted amidohydrolase